MEETHLSGPMTSSALKVTTTKSETESSLFREGKNGGLNGTDYNWGEEMVKRAH